MGPGRKEKHRIREVSGTHTRDSVSLTPLIRTFRAISEKEKILQKLEEIAAELDDDMERGGWAGRTVTLKYKLDTYEVFSRAKSFNRWIRTKAELYEAGKELLQPEWPLRLRLIGLRVTKLKDLRKKDGGILKVGLSHCFGMYVQD
jgi:DNA polymerase kappa